MDSINRNEINLYFLDKNKLPNYKREPEMGRSISFL